MLVFWSIQSGVEFGWWQMMQIWLFHQNKCSQIYLEYGWLGPGFGPGGPGGPSIPGGGALYGGRGALLMFCCWGGPGRNPCWGGGGPGFIWNEKLEKLEKQELFQRMSAVHFLQFGRMGAVTFSIGRRLFHLQVVIAWDKETWCHQHKSSRYFHL